MPKLTRTQKYADLRAQLTNDGETSITTAELSSFEEQLKSLEKQALPKTEIVNIADKVNELLANQDDDFNTQNIDIAPIKEVKDDNNFGVIENPGVDEVVEDNKDVDDEIPHIFISAEELEDVYLDTPIEDKKEEFVDTFEDYFNKIEQEKNYDFTTEEKEEVEIETLAPFNPEENILFPEEEKQITRMNFGDVEHSLEDLNVQDNNEEIIIEKNEEPNLIDVEISEEAKFLQSLNHRYQNDLNLINSQLNNVSINNPLVFDNSPEVEIKLDEQEVELPEVEVDNIFEEEKTQLVFGEEENIDSHPSLDELYDFVQKEQDKNWEEEKRYEAEHDLDSFDDGISSYNKEVVINSDNYIQETLNEVDEFNRAEGEKLVSDIPVSIIDEFRHTEEVIPSYEEEKQDDFDTIEYNVPVNENNQLTDELINYHEPDNQDLEVHKVIDDVLNNFNEPSNDSHIAEFENFIDEEILEANLNIEENFDEFIPVEETIEEIIPEEVVEEVIPVEEVVEEIIPEEVPEVSYIKEEGQEEVEAIVEHDYFKDEYTPEVVEEVYDDNSADDYIDEDEEAFSNTVSLEINKIMEELNNKNDEVHIPNDLADVKRVEEVNVNASDFDKNSVPDFISAFFNDDDDEDEDEFYPEEHPSLAIAEPVEDDIKTEVVEIKNLSEMDEDIIHNTIEKTIPFVVEDAEVIEDSTPNKILNIILGVLIVILLGVLVVIIYYILVARGII